MIARQMVGLDELLAMDSDRWTFIARSAGIQRFMPIAAELLQETSSEGAKSQEACKVCAVITVFSCEVLLQLPHEIQHTVGRVQAERVPPRMEPVGRKNECKPFPDTKDCEACRCWKHLVVSCRKWGHRIFQDSGCVDSKGTVLEASFVWQAQPRQLAAETEDGAAPPERPCASGLWADQAWSKRGEVLWQSWQADCDLQDLRPRAVRELVFELHWELLVSIWDLQVKRIRWRRLDTACLQHLHLLH